MGQTLIRALVALALLAATVRAQPQPADADTRARDLHAQGMRHYDLAEYDAAIVAFREAYQLAPAPGLLFNIAQAYRLKGPDGCVLSVRFYKNYLLAAPTARNRPFVELTLRDLEPCPAPAAEPASLPVAAAPVAAPLPRPTPSPSIPSLPEPLPRDPIRWGAWGMTAAGAAGAITGLVLYLQAGSRYDELETTCASHTCPRSTWESARTKERVGIGLGIAGAAAAAVGGVWLYVTRDRAPDAPIVVPTTGAPGAALVVTF